MPAPSNTEDPAEEKKLKIPAWVLWAGGIIIIFMTVAGVGAGIYAYKKYKFNHDVTTPVPTELSQTRSLLASNSPQKPVNIHDAKFGSQSFVDTSTTQMSTVIKTGHMFQENQNPLSFTAASPQSRSSDASSSHQHYFTTHSKAGTKSKSHDTSESLKESAPMVNPRPTLFTQTGDTTVHKSGKSIVSNIAKVVPQSKCHTFNQNSYIKNEHSIHENLENSAYIKEIFNTYAPVSNYPNAIDRLKIAQSVLDEEGNKAIRALEENLKTSPSGLLAYILVLPYLRIAVLNSSAKLLLGTPDKAAREILNTALTDDLKEYYQSNFDKCSIASQLNRLILNPGGLKMYDTYEFLKLLSIYYKYDNALCEPVWSKKFKDEVFKVANKHNITF